MSEAEVTSSGEPSDVRDPRIIALVNPHARYSRREVEASFARFLPPKSELLIRETDPDLPVAELLGEDLDGATALVAVGGDGTVSDVARAVVGKNIPVGIIPGGTTNMVAKVNRVPARLDRAVQLITGKHCIEHIDVGLTDHRVLLHMGGAGIDARIFETSAQSLKRRIGWLAYVFPALTALRSDTSLVTVTVDDASLTVQSKLVVVANADSLLLAGLRVFAGASRNDGMLDVIVFTPEHLTATLRTLTGLMAMRLQRSPYAIRLRGREITVEADPPLPYEIDGDMAGRTPFRVTVVPGALQMICGPIPRAE